MQNIKSKILLKNLKIELPEKIYKYYDRKVIAVLLSFQKPHSRPELVSFKFRLLASITKKHSYTFMAEKFIWAFGIKLFLRSSTYCRHIKVFH